MSRSRPVAELLVGKHLAGYSIVQLIASGGTGHVYLAERAPKEPRVALKVLRAEHRSRPALVARFEREALAAARIDHPNVLRVLDVQREDGTLVSFAMELLVGMDLADTLAYARALNPVRATRIAFAAAGALDAAHAAGVIHRDVKPENLFLVHEPDGREVVKLVDFGFSYVGGDAHLVDEKTGERLVAGTPEYLAPEQSSGGDPAPESDVYSLGVVVFEMLTGEPPFQGRYPAIAELHATAPVPALASFGASGVSKALEAAIRRALAKEPERRYPSAAAFGDALRETPEGESARRADR